MLQRRCNNVLSILILLIIGMGLGYYLYSNRPIPVNSDILRGRIDSISSVVKEKEHKVDSLRSSLEQIRKSKEELVRGAMEKGIAISKLNKELEEFERRYSGKTASNIFSRDSVLTQKEDGTAVISKEGLSDIAGIVEENRIQRDEIKNLDSIVTVQRDIIEDKDTIIETMVVQESVYKKKAKKKIGVAAVIGVIVGLIGGALVK